ncbi:Wzz/FepE/Etk N-terminal domain-containing protein [Amycolatopsis thermophila]|uniref:Capsular polysaccharide biosynthesis protein n=1 Tax=Amycolatopsis thermophila TaxID=206084 RepID=A0ABU0EQR6_9PSEU|nr:Wzz/FepE/Etk N-terminal domain-containing protein [Amycolatopsis thermophila]MDQ0377643.1 capsular polysaccharide biosynthesis protein [Amycolatopsis thermophila]
MTTPDTTQNAQPLLDLQRVLIAIRRRRRLWLSAALLGLLAGTVLAFLSPTPPTAVTRLLVLHSEDAPNDSGTLIKTDVAILQTTRIADAALKKLGSTEPPERFLKSYAGTGLTNNVLELQVRADSYGEAVAKAQALADAFIADHAQRMQSAADAEAQALLGQRDQIQNELTDVDRQIASSANRNSQIGPAELQSLYARRADLTSRVSDFTNKANEARIGTPELAAGTQIVDAPRPLTESALGPLVTNAGIGLGFGLIAGLGLAAVMSVVRDRPLLRREISAHLGASVIAQLPKPRRGPWGSVAAQRKRAAATLARTVRDGGSVSVLELGCPKVAAELALEMAEQLGDGIKIVDDLPHRDVTALAPDRVIDGSAPEEGRIGVGSVSAGTAWTDLRRLGAETVLVVRAGKASTLWLHTVARQLADLGIPIIGVVLVAPDPRDRTDGTLWDGLHTALRGRAEFTAAATAKKDSPTKWFAPLPATAPRAEQTVTLTPVHELPTKQFTPVTTRADGPEMRLNGKLPLEREG